ncbi:hypothetical protein Misp06_02891 [Microbulbifer sp. NBRC 101763]|uniref:abscisic acid-deficient protein Aba4 family protein n=1 Tax=Microbulbifer sp. NBRC 101763 TaxID=1113820 RepID=UPI0030AB3BD2
MNQKLRRIYSLQAKLVRVGWLLLFFLPLWKWTQTLVWFIVIIVSSAYLYLTLFGKKYEGELAYQVSYKDFFNLEGIMAMFTNPRTVVVGWFHFLAFDLLVGLHILLDSQQLSISYWLILPILLLTLMLGPAGLVAYLMLRLVHVSVFNI